MAIIPGEIDKNIIIDTPQKQKARKQAVVLVGLLVVITLVVYFGFFAGSATPTTINNMNAMPGIVPGMVGADAIAGPVEMTIPVSIIFDDLGKATLDNPIFQDKKFQALVLSDRLPVVIGEKGRENPFAPF